MKTSQQHAVANYRRRLRERGLARYEVRGLEQDKELVRKFARRLAANDAKAEQLRSDMVRETGASPTRKGGIYAALRRSPAVGADLDLSREVVPERDIDL